MNNEPDPGSGVPPFLLAAVREAFKGAKIIRREDFARLGLTPPQLKALEAEGLVSRPEHGVYVDPDAETENGYREALASMLTEHGVIWGKHAAKLHGLVADFEGPVEMLVPYATSLKPRPWLRVRRVREVSLLETGVEPMENDLGVPVRITSKARTVVDMFRFFRGETSGNDDRFAVESLRSYIGRDGDDAELIRTAKEFDPRIADLIEELVSEMKGYMGGHGP